MIEHLHIEARGARLLHSRSLRLVFPKVAALAIAMPLLVLWTTAIALIGQAAVAMLLPVPTWHTSQAVVPNGMWLASGALMLKPMLGSAYTAALAALWQDAQLLVTGAGA